MQKHMQHMYSIEACTANPLYDSECPGYDAAYLSLQCEANPLYDSSCTGYATAFLEYQCEQNPLYDDESLHNELNPLYDDTMMRILINNVI